MNENKFFLHQIKRTNGEFTKGIVVHDTFEAAKQGYHPPGDVGGDPDLINRIKRSELI